MKKSTKTILAFLLLAAMACTLFGCAKENVGDSQIAGGYTDVESAPTEEETAYFDEAVKGTEYEDYTIVSLLGTQVVAGTNYKFLCETPDGAEKIVVVYRDLEKTCSVLSVEDPA